jgi:hypothetical protein
MVPVVGSITDWRTIERVLELHGPELASETLEEVPAWLRRLGASVTLENETARLSRVVAIKSPTSSWDTLELRSLTLYELAERFPDAVVGL